MSPADPITALSDGQFGLLLAALTGGLGAIAAAVRWGVSRVVKSTDASTSALVANTASNAVLTVKVDDMCQKLDGISDWMEHAAPLDMPSTPRSPRRENTPIGGVGVYGIGKQPRPRDNDK